MTPADGCGARRGDSRVSVVDTEVRWIREESARRRVDGVRGMGVRFIDPARTQLTGRTGWAYGAADGCGGASVERRLGVGGALLRIPGAGLRGGVGRAAPARRARPGGCVARVRRHPGAGALPAGAAPFGVRDRGR